MRRIASIDLGTNTFHILIVDIDDKQAMKEVYRERIYVDLAEDGIEFISDKVQKRIYAALSLFRQLLNKYQVINYMATGTAALRTAQNGSIILSKIKELYSIEVLMISGDREASLIYKGIRMAFDFDTNDYLIMDIGGGSVEFIIVANKTKVWSMSFPIGVSVLYNRFKGEDAYTSSTIKEIKLYLKEHLESLLFELDHRSIKYLIGASGSFDVIETLVTNKKAIDKCVLIYRDQEYNQLYNVILSSTLEERTMMQGIPEKRVKLMPIALLLIEYIMDIIQPEGILVSPYAMKEGLISEIIEKK